MINFIKEGDKQYIGLNIKTHWGPWPWISFSWVWLDLPTHLITRYKIRFRSKVFPWVIYNIEKINYIENYLKYNNLGIIEFDMLEINNSLNKIDSTDRG